MQKITNVEQLLGKRIQKIRKSKGYTQQQFAEMVGLSTNYLSDIERGKSSARLDKLVSIINALDCTANDIFCDTLNNGHTIVSSQLSEKIDKLKPKDREVAFAILEAFISKVE